ncbi:MAG: DUF3618 domain-containing protein [Dermatophilaceae bacterium]
MSEPRARSVEQIEAEIEASRTRLASTVDQLAYRAQPKEIARREVASLKTSFDGATRYDDGTLRSDRVAAVLGAASVVLLLLGLIRRRRR